MNRQDSDAGLRSPQRRRLLLAGLAGLLVVELQGCRSWTVGSESAPWTPEAMLGTLADFEAAARLGRAYLAISPQEGEHSRLSALLMTAVSAHSVPRGPGRSPSEVFGALDRCIRSEYATADIVQVRGWLLSVTEARLYALAALSA